MKALLIDPKTRTITSIDVNGKLEDYYKHLECSTIECPVIYPNNDALYCDEEGWLHYTEEMCGFMFPEWSYAILGKGLIIGTDDMGNSKDCKSTSEDFANIIWRTEVQMYIQGRKNGLI